MEDVFGAEYNGDQIALGFNSKMTSAAEKLAAVAVVAGLGLAEREPHSAVRAALVALTSNERAGLGWG